MGVLRGLLKFCRAPIYRAHLPVVFAIAQLSCIVLYLTTTETVHVKYALYRLYGAVFWKFVREILQFCVFQVPHSDMVVVMVSVRNTYYDRLLAS